MLRGNNINSQSKYLFKFYFILIISANPCNWLRIGCILQHRKRNFSISGFLDFEIIHLFTFCIIIFIITPAFS